MSAASKRPTRSLVTGALGFVGRHLADRLVARGDEVLVCDIIDDPEIAADRAYECVDVTDRDALDAAVAGVDVVFHVASLVATRQTHTERIWAVNQGGTRHVIEACRAAGVQRLVYVSSASVVYEGRDIEDGDEELPYTRRSQAPYADSKVAAEKDVLAAHDDATLKTCAIRPHVVFGPGDGRFLPALIGRARAGKLRMGVGRKERLSDFTYIDNLVDALVAADEKLASDPAVGGEAFFVTNGEPMPFWGFVDRFLVAMGRPETRGRVPYSVAYLAATVAELFDAMRGDVERPESGLTRFAVRYMCTHHYFSIAKARRMLGYQPVVSIEQGIARTVEHLRSSGQIGR